MGWERNNYGCDCNYSYSNNNYRNSDSKECGCDAFFKNISRGEHVKVILKGGDAVKGSFVNVKGNVVEIANAQCHHEHECKCDRKKVKITTICCDDIVAVEV